MKYRVGGGVIAAVAAVAALAAHAQTPSAAQKLGKFADRTVADADLRSTCAAELAEYARFQRGFKVNNDQASIDRTIASLLSDSLVRDEFQVNFHLDATRKQLAKYTSPPDAYSAQLHAKICTYERALLQMSGKATLTAAPVTAAAAPAPAPAPAAGPAVAATGEACATPNTGPNNPAFLQYNAAVSKFLKAWPNKETGGSRNQFVFTMYTMNSSAKILEQYRPCLSAEDYKVNQDYFANAYTAARRGCEQLSAPDAACTPTYPWP